MRFRSFKRAAVGLAATAVVVALIGASTGPANADAVLDGLFATRTVQLGFLPSAVYPDREAVAHLLFVTDGAATCAVATGDNLLRPTRCDGPVPLESMLQFQQTNFIGLYRIHTVGVVRCLEADNLLDFQPCASAAQTNQLWWLVGIEDHRPVRIQSDSTGGCLQIGSVYVELAPCAGPGAQQFEPRSVTYRVV